MMDGLANRSSEGAPGGVARRGITARLMRVGVPTLLWAFIIIAAPTFVSKLRQDKRASQEDFAVYYYSALEMRRGINPYTTDFTQAARASGLDIHAISHGNEPPPFLALVVGPLTHLPLDKAYWIWQTANLLFFLIAMLLLLGPGSGLAPWRALTLAALAALYPAVASVFWFGQSKLMALGLLVLGMRLIEQQRPRLAGITLALVAMLRGFPFVLGGYLLLQQRQRIIFSAAAGVAIIGIATIWIAGLTASLGFVSALLTVYVDHWNAMRRDFSIYFLVSRQIWAISPNPGFALNLLRHVLIVVVELSVLVATCRATLMVPGQEDSDSRLFSLWVATAIFLLPVAWDHDLTLMLIPFAVLILVAARGEASRRAVTMAIVSYILLIFWDYLTPARYECGFLSMLAAYLSAYWLVVDNSRAVMVPLRAMPTEIWRRLTPAT